MRRIVFFELPQAHLDLLLRAREDPACRIAGVLARDPSAVSLRIADLLGLPNGVTPDSGLPACDLIVAGDESVAPSAPGMRVVSSEMAASDWGRAMSGEAAPVRTGPRAPHDSDHASETRAPGAPRRTGWRRVQAMDSDLLDVAGLALRPHGLAGWLLCESCEEAHAVAGAFLPADGREGVVFERPEFNAGPEAFSTWSALPRVKEALIGGEAVVLLDEELKPRDGDGSMAGIFVPFGDGGAFRGALLLRSGDRFRTADVERLEAWCRRAGALLAQASESWHAVRAARQRAARDAMEEVIEGSSVAEASEAAAGALADAMGAARAGLWIERETGLAGAGAGSAAWASQVIATGRMKRYELRDAETADGEESWIVVIPVAGGDRRGAAVLEDLVVVPDELEAAIEEAGALGSWALEAIARKEARG